MYLICFCVFLLNLHLNYAASNNLSISEAVDVTDVADLLIAFLGHDGKNDSTRIKNLKEKLAKIENYVVDRHKYNDRIRNETKAYYLNETNFYLALQEKDYLLRFKNDTRNLYLKLKEKMNRDDLLSILAVRGEKKTKKSARRMLEQQYRPSRRSEKVLDDVVDKFLGEAAYDNHKFDEEDKFSKYWDPRVELEEKKSYYHPSGRRIFKGERTTIRYYPFMVSIQVMGRFWCGGVLYWTDLAITSAACLQLLHNNRFYRENPKQLAVRVGSNHSRVGGEMIEALEVYFHPAYKPKTLENNIALIRLRRHIKLSYHRIPKLIEISHVEGGVPFTAEVLLLGWGVSKTSQTIPYEPLYLQRKMLPVYPNKLCSEVYGDKFIARSMFCAGTVSTGEGACSHDAGGPAVLAGRLVGIISFGPSICGYPDAPTVLTLIGNFADWIETVNETMPPIYRGDKATSTTTVDPFVMYFYKHTAVTPYTLPQMPVLIKVNKLKEKEADLAVPVRTTTTTKVVSPTTETSTAATETPEPAPQPQSYILRTSKPEDMPFDDISIHREEKESKDSDSPETYKETTRHKLSANVHFLEDSGMGEDLKITPFTTIADDDSSSETSSSKSKESKKVKKSKRKPRKEGTTKKGNKKNKGVKRMRSANNPLKRFPVDDIKDESKTKGDDDKNTIYKLKELMKILDSKKTSVEDIKPPSKHKEISELMDFF